TGTTAVSLQVGNGTNPFINWVGSGAHTVQVRNGGVLFLSAPDATAYAVTAATGDILKILNNDGSTTANVNICIAGCSAQRPLPPPPLFDTDPPEGVPPMAVYSGRNAAVRVNSTLCYANKWTVNDKTDQIDVSTFEDLGFANYIGGLREA